MKDRLGVKKPIKRPANAYFGHKKIPNVLHQNIRNPSYLGVIQKIFYPS